MEAKELRLNNYVFGIYTEETENDDIEEKCICSVDVIDGVGCTEYKIWASSIEDKGKLIEEWEGFEPIPLTEQWLLDFGARKRMEGVFVYDRFRLIWKESYKYWYVIDETEAAYLTKIGFVHEWQNFVYAMNTEELTIKPNALK